MGALSWVRLSRRLPGVVRQREFVNLEALIDAESDRAPARTFFILSCAIPAGIATFGGLSVFAAWVSGVRGLPLLLGSGGTVILSACAWYIFYRLYRNIPPAKRRLRDLILKFSERYASFGNIILGEPAVPDAFAEILDEVAGIYLRYCTEGVSPLSGAPDKAVSAIEDAMSRLMEVAVLKEQGPQIQALLWAKPLVEELRLLDQTLTEHALTAKAHGLTDPIARLRDARTDLETNISAIQELDQHVSNQ